MPAAESNQNAITYRSQDLTIELEPLEVEERTGSVQLSIRVAWESRRQSLHWVASAWTLYSALDEFEVALHSNRQATLTDISGYPVLRITMDDKCARLVLNPVSKHQSPDGDRLTVQIAAESDLPSALAHTFRAFPKWW